MGKDLKGKELGVGISQESTGLYSARFVDRFGKRKHKRFKKLQECRAWLADAIYVDEHSDISMPSDMLVDHWFDYWIGIKKKTVRPNTVRNYTERYIRNIKPLIGKMSLSDVKPLHCQKIFYDMADQGYRTSTIYQARITLYNMLEYAKENEVLRTNPCKRSVKSDMGKPSEKKVALERDVQKIFLRYAEGQSYENQYRFILQTGLRTGELVGLKWEDIDFSTAQLHVRRTINRLAKYEAHDGENKTEIVFGTPKTKNSRRTIPLTRTMADELTRWKQQQAQDKIRAGDKYTDYGFIVTNEFGHYFEQKTFKDYYDRMLKDADIGHFTFHALRHTFATRALERGMDYKTLSAILGHYSVAFTMDTYVHSMDEHKRHEMDKMNDMFGVQYRISVENQPYPVLCTITADGCTAHVPDFPKIAVHTLTLDATLLEVKQQIQKALHQYKYPPIPTRQEQIVVPDNSVLVLVKAG